MPNGGPIHCGHCRNYEQITSRCELRGVQIEFSHWSKCRNFDRPGSEVVGPLYAKVFVIQNGAGCYVDIPYFDGIRVDTDSKLKSGNTFLRSTDSSGIYHEFSTVADYLSFYEMSGRPY